MADGLIISPFCKYKSYDTGPFRAAEDFSPPQIKWSGNLKVSPRIGGDDRVTSKPVLSNAEGTR